MRHNTTRLDTGSIQHMQLKHGRGVARVHLDTGSACVTRVCAPVRSAARKPVRTVCSAARTVRKLVRTVRSAASTVRFVVRTTLRTVRTASRKYTLLVHKLTNKHLIITVHHCCSSTVLGYSSTE